MEETQSKATPVSEAIQVLRRAGLEPTCGELAMRNFQLAVAIATRDVDWPGKFEIYPHANYWDESRGLKVSVVSFDGESFVVCNHDSEAPAFVSVRGFLRGVEREANLVKYFEKLPRGIRMYKGWFGPQPQP